MLEANSDDIRERAFANEIPAGMEGMIPIDRRRKLYSSPAAIYELV